MTALVNGVDGAIVFGYEIGKFNEDLDFAPEAIDGGYCTVKDDFFIAVFDLADFDNFTFDYKLAKFPKEVSSRSFNFARVVEHEFVGHGMEKKGDGSRVFWEISEGPVEKICNEIRAQLGLEWRVTYSNNENGV